MSQFNLPPIYRRHHSKIRFALLMGLVGITSAFLVWGISECCLRLAERYIPADDRGGEFHEPSGGQHR